MAYHESYEEQQQRAEKEAVEVMDLAEREGRFQSVSQLTDRILNPRVTTLQIVRSGTQVPAWTDGRRITLNASVLPEIGTHASKESLTVWMGANYHELGHTLYSPRKSSRLMKKIRRAKENSKQYNQLNRVENLIEDQRQERFMVKRYRYITPYLIQVCIDLVISGVTQKPSTGNPRNSPKHAQQPTKAMKRNHHIGEAWPWLAGRTWIDDNLRQKSLHAFEGDGVELANLIGQYQRLPDVANADADEAFDILLEIHDVLKELPQFMDDGVFDLPIGCPNGNGEPQEQANGGQPVPMPQAADETEAAPSAGSDGDPAKDQSDTGVSDDAEEEGNTAAGATGRETMADLEKELKEEVKEANRTDEGFKDHLKSVTEAVNFDKNDNKSGLKQAGTTQLHDASHELRGTARRLGLTFRKYVDLAMPSWEFGTNTGKLNVPRWVHRTGFDLDSMFDRFDEGKLDEISLDVTILVDVSSSMNQPLNDKLGLSQWEWRRQYEEKHGRYPSEQDGRVAGRSNYLDLASEACWVIRKAVQRAEGDTTVIAYNSKAYLVSQTGEKPDPHKVEYMKPDGSTNPTDAILDTYQRLKGVEASHRVVVALTDGDWYAGGEVMRKISQKGVTTVGVRVGRGQWNTDAASQRQYAKAMGVSHYAAIKNPMEMVALFEGIVSQALADTVQVS